MNDIGEINIDSSNVDELVKSFNNIVISKYKDENVNRFANPFFQWSGKNYNSYTTDLETAVNTDFQISHWMATYRNSKGMDLRNFTFISGNPYLNVDTDGIYQDIVANANEWNLISFTYQVVDSSAVPQALDVFNMQIEADDITVVSKNMINTESKIFNVFAFVKYSSYIAKRIRFKPTDTNSSYHIKLINSNLSYSTTTNQFSKNELVTTENGFISYKDEYGNIRRIKQDTEYFVGHTFNADIASIGSGGGQNKRFVLISDVQETLTVTTNMTNSIVNGNNNKIGTDVSLHITGSNFTMKDVNIDDGYLILSNLSDSVIHINYFNPITTNPTGLYLDNCSNVEIKITKFDMSGMDTAILFNSCDKIKLDINKITTSNTTGIGISGSLADSIININYVNANVNIDKIYDITGDNNEININSVEISGTPST